MPSVKNEFVNDTGFVTISLTWPEGKTNEVSLHITHVSRVGEVAKGQWDFATLTRLCQMLEDAPEFLQEWIRKAPQTCLRDKRIHVDMVQEVRVHWAAGCHAAFRNKQVKLSLDLEHFPTELDVLRARCLAAEEENARLRRDVANH